MENIFGDEFSRVSLKPLAKDMDKFQELTQYYDQLVLRYHQGDPNELDDEITSDYIRLQLETDYSLVITFDSEQTNEKKITRQALADHLKTIKPQKLKIRIE